MAAAAASITAQPATTIQPFPDPDRFIRLPLARFSPHVSKFPICQMRFGNYRSAAILSPQESVLFLSGLPWINWFGEALVHTQNFFPFIIVEIRVLPVGWNKRQPKVGRYRAQCFEGPAIASLLALLGEGSEQRFLGGAGRLDGDAS